MDVIESYLQPFRLFMLNLSKLVVPMVALVLYAYTAMQLMPEWVPKTYSFYLLIITGIVAIVSSLYPLRTHAYIAYGIALGGFSVLYMACYQAYTLFGLLSARDLFFYVTIVNVWALITAMRFRGWLLAVLSITVACALPTLLLNVFFTKQLFALYVLMVLALVVLVAYIMNWLELIVLGTAWYLLYNPLLFRFTSIEPKQGLLTVNEVLYMMGALFAIYTCIPWIYSLFAKKQRIFDSLCITLAGAYTFAMIRFVVNSHLIKLKELPFFIKILIRDAPTMTNVQVQMFFIYALVYGILCIGLVLINRRATAVLSTLINLCCLSFFGLLYVHSSSVDLVIYLVRLHHFIVNIVG